MSTHISRTPKYRPSLTGNNILKILELAKTETPISSESTSLIAALDSWRWKIENSLASVSHTSSPHTTLEDKLGITRTPEPIDDNSAFLSKEERWEKAYTHYIVDPISCSLAQIAMAREHMYLNGYMTPEERELFESGEPI